LGRTKKELKLQELKLKPHIKEKDRQQRDQFELHHYMGNELLAATTFSIFPKSGI